MSPSTRWFLPESPDVIGMLRAQATVTIEASEALVAWAKGHPDQEAVVRAKEHEADDRKRELRTALSEAFTTPLDPEDLYVMSEYLDRVLNGAKDAVREAEVMAIPPDEHTAAMASCLLEGVRLLDESFERLRPGRKDDKADARESADAAVKAQRHLEHIYREAMSALLSVDDLREVMGRRELYRRFSRTSQDLETVADRVWYATLKEG
jgi:uncharacterized protein Yka (UPF0111/DUF47 family)